MKITALACAGLFALVFIGATVLFVTAEIDAGLHCAKATYHSAECKDIRTVQAAMITFGGTAAALLLVQTLVFLTLRKRRGEQRSKAQSDR